MLFHEMLHDIFSISLFLIGLGLGGLGLGLGLGLERSIPQDWLGFLSFKLIYRKTIFTCS